MKNANLPPLDFSPEMELLLCCARTQMDAKRRKRIETLLQLDIDWEGLIPLARWHAQIPLLYRHLKTICSSTVPEPLLAKLREAFYTNIQRNLFLTSELLKLLKLFDTNGILAVPYKGPVLAATVYGNLSLRQFVDLDILVRQRDVPKAQALMVDGGYELQSILNEMHETPNLLSPHHYTLIHRERNVRVELHWRITPKYFACPVELELMMDSLEAVNLGGFEIQHFRPEELLLILCVHGAKHRPVPWGRLGWLCDVAELIDRYPEMNWKRVMEKAHIWGCKRILFIGLLLARDLLGTVIPQKCLQGASQSSITKRLTVQARQWLLAGDNVSPGGFAQHLFYIMARERLRDKAVYFLHLLRKVIARTKTTLQRINPLDGSI